MAKIYLACGSVFGSAILTTDEIEQALKQAGHEILRPENPTVDDLTDETIEYLIVCTSSTGNGDVPDNLSDFHTALLTQFPRIIHLKFAVVALGDSSYDTFCGGGLAIDHALLELGARQLAEPLKIDALETTEPELLGAPWVMSLLAGG